MCFFNSAGDVDHRQQHENVGLDKGNQNAHQHDRHRNDQRRHEDENHDDDFVAVHVAEQTQGQRQRAGQVADDLDRQHQRRHPPDRAGEVLEVVQTVLLDADDVGHQEDQ